MSWNQCYDSKEIFSSQKCVYCSAKHILLLLSRMCRIQNCESLPLINTFTLKAMKCTKISNVEYRILWETSSQQRIVHAWAINKWVWTQLLQWWPPQWPKSRYFGKTCNNYIIWPDSYLEWDQHKLTYTITVEEISVITLPLSEALKRFSKWKRYNRLPNCSSYSSDSGKPASSNAP